MSTDDEEKNDKICNEIDALNLANDDNDDKINNKSDNKTITEKVNGCKNNVKIDDDKPKEKKGFWPSYVKAVETYLNDLQKEAQVS